MGATQGAVRTLTPLLIKDRILPRDDQKSHRGVFAFISGKTRPETEQGFLYCYCIVVGFDLETPGELGTKFAGEGTPHGVHFVGNVMRIIPGSKMSLSSSRSSQK